MQNHETKPMVPSQSLGLIEYLKVFAKHRKMIYLTVAAVFVISVGYSLILPSIYTARALLLPAQEDKGLAAAMMAQLGGLANTALGSLGGTTNTDLYVSMLKSEAIKDPIIDRFKLMKIYKKKYLTDTYAALDRNIAIAAGRKDSIITISVQDRDPVRAADMANAYVEELGRLTVRLNIAGAGKNRSFLEERLAGAKVDLVRAEEALKTFQGKNKTIQVPFEAQATIKGVAEMKAALVLKEVELSTIRRSLTESSQEVKNLKTSIANLKSQIANYETGTGGGAVPSLGTVPQLGQDYVRLMREFKIQETLVELLTKQYEMARLSEAKDVAPIQVLQKAKVPERKSKPSRSKIVMSSVFIALLASLVLSIILEKISNMPAKEKDRWKSLVKIT